MNSINWLHMFEGNATACNVLNRALPLLPRYPNDRSKQRLGYTVHKLLAAKAYSLDQGMSRKSGQEEGVSSSPLSRQELAGGKCTNCACNPPQQQ